MERGPDKPPRSTSDRPYWIGKKVIISALKIPNDSKKTLFVVGALNQKAFVTIGVDGRDLFYRPHSALVP